MLEKTLGPYRIESELGSGGMGKVYLAARGEDRFALKIVHPHLLSEPGFFKRFLREAEIGKAVTHPNVVRCFDCDQLVVDGTTHAFLVMEYVEGQTLRDLLDELETVPEELCRHIGREVSKGLVAIHGAGVVHRDLKPENVLITPDHEVKVMDLGVARLADEAIRLSMSGAFVGSVLYASPEQFRCGGEDLDGRADLFSLGVILYELASGAHPHPGDNFMQVMARLVEEKPRRLGERNPQLSAFFEEVVHCLLAKDRVGRFGSAVKLLAALTEGEKSTWWGGRARTLRAETRRPLRRIRIPRDTAVYGREEELQLLGGLYDQARAGDGRVVLIEGEAGIGKTRLVDELIARLRRRGEDLNFLFGSYPPGGAATASGAWSTAYREQFGEEGLEDTLAEYLTLTPVLIPAFAALLRGEPPPEGGQLLTKDSIQTVFVHATRALASERPTVVLIEDLHFAPEEGRALFASLALAVPEHRILLVGTARPGVPDNWRANVERLDPASRIGLSRLGPKDLGKLLIDAFQSERLAEELALKIATKSDGNPFFVFEIIRGLREGQFITRRPDGTWASTQVIREIRIPSSVQDLIQARIGDLDEEEQELVDVAACCGFVFDPGLVAEAAGMRKIPALRRLGHLERSQRLVRSAGDEFVFDHHQIQEALHSAISPPLRKEYHAALGRALLNQHPEPDGRAAVKVCEHFLRGERGPEVLRHLDAALDHLDSRYRYEQVVAMADQALAMEGLLTGHRRAEILLRKATRLGYLGRRDVEQSALQDVLALAREAGDKDLRSRAHRALGSNHLSQSRLEAAQEEIRRARDLAREIGDRKGEAKDLGGMGLVFAYLGRYEEALVHHDHALAISEELGDRRGEGAAAGNKGLVLHYLGRTEEAIEHYERSLAIAGELGARDIEVSSRGTLGAIHGSVGNHEEARTQFERCLAIAVELGDRKGEGAAAGNLGIVSLNLGFIGEARARFEHGLGVAREVGARLSEGIALGNLGPLHARLGAFDRGREQLSCALAIFRDIGARREEGYALHGMAVVAESGGDYEEAGRFCEQALALRREIHYERGVTSTQSLLGSIRLAEGRSDEGRELLEQVLSAKADGPSPGASALASALLAFHFGGNPEAALKVLKGEDSSLGCESRMEICFLLWKATEDTTHLCEAYRLLRSLCANAPEEYRETMIRNVPLHRDIMAAWEEHGADGVP